MNISMNLSISRGRHAGLPRLVCPIGRGSPNRTKWAATV